MKRILRVLGMVLLALAAAYVADYLSLRFQIPASRRAYSAVQVQTLYAVKQKNGRLEYSLGDIEDERCVLSVFPQMGFAPCWYLSRHATRQIETGQAPFKPRTAQSPTATAIAGKVTHPVENLAPLPAAVQIKGRQTSAGFSLPRRATPACVFIGLGGPG